MSKLCVVGIICVAMLAHAGARTENWPEFRGPDGQGHATEGHLPVEWSTTKNVTWKQAIPGRGWSSAVLQNGRLYLTTAVEAGGDGNLSLRALGLDTATGGTLWNTEIFTLPAGRIHTKNSHASPTPLIEGDRLYVHFGHQGTAC